MKLLFVLVGLALVWLSGCMPHPLDGLDRSGAAPGGAHRFRVHWNAETAQATRVNPVWRPDYASVVAGAVEATQTLTGCAAIPDKGDVALVNLSLVCPAPGG